MRCQIAYLHLSISCTAVCEIDCPRIKYQSRSAYLYWIYNDSILVCGLSIGLVDDLSDSLSDSLGHGLFWNSVRMGIREIRMVQETTDDGVGWILES